MDIFAENIPLALLFHSKFGCCIFQSLIWHQRSGMDHTPARQNLHATHACAACTYVHTAAADWCVQTQTLRIVIAFKLLYSARRLVM